MIIQPELAQYARKVARQEKWVITHYWDTEWKEFRDMICVLYAEDATFTQFWSIAPSIIHGPDFCYTSYREGFREGKVIYITCGPTKRREVQFNP